VNRLSLVKLALAAIGVAVWGYGYRADVGRFRIAGMIILGVAVALRFLPGFVRDRIDGHR
jgi:hypothetical protein